MHLFRGASGMYYSYIQPRHPIAPVNGLRQASGFSHTYQLHTNRTLSTHLYIHTSYTLPTLGFTFYTHNTHHRLQRLAFTYFTTVKVLTIRSEYNGEGIISSTHVTSPLSPVASGQPYYFATTSLDYT